MIIESLDLVGEITSSKITKVIVRATEFNNKNIYVLKIGAASLFQIRASVVTNWGSYYNLGQSLLQNRAAIFFIFFIF